MRIVDWLRSIHVKSCPLAIALTLLLCACQSSPPSAKQDGGDRFFSADDKRFEADHRSALSTMFRSDLTKARKSHALEGILRLMIGHELGHAFQRTHGSFDGIHPEDFADLFSLNLVADIFSAHPSPYLPTEEYVTIMNAFLANVPADAHLGEGGAAEMRRRRMLYSCAHYGIVGDYARSDPIAYYAESHHIPPQDVRLFDRKSTISGEARETWLGREAAKRRLARAYLKSREAVVSAVTLERCIATERKFREFLVSRLASPERTRRTIAEEGVFSWDEVRISFEYKLPETEGAQLVFADATPSLPGTAPGISYLPWLLVKLGWFPKTSTTGVVRLEYCGIGHVNAYLDLKGDNMILTLCYEIGENVLAHPELYPKANPNLYKPMNDYAEKNFPDIMRRTRQMMADAE